MYSGRSHEWLIEFLFLLFFPFRAKKKKNNRKLNAGALNLYIWTQLCQQKHSNFIKQEQIPWQLRHHHCNHQDHNCPNFLPFILFFLTHSSKIKIKNCNKIHFTKLQKCFTILGEKHDFPQTLRFRKISNFIQFQGD